MCSRDQPGTREAAASGSCPTPDVAGAVGGRSLWGRPPPAGVSEGLRPGACGRCPAQPRPVPVGRLREADSWPGVLLVSACIPILRLARTPKKVLFYCHFPDQLLTKRESFLKRIYRAPLDWLEEYTTGMADCIVVNSSFTANVFKDTFTSLNHIKPDVLYPSLNVSTFETIVPADIANIIPQGRKYLFLSINRFERKKNLALALEALHDLRGRLSAQEWNEVHLVLAGGYDERVSENVEHYEELKNIASKLNISKQVTFVRSFSDEQKIALFNNAVCVLYTPSNEHFGIVPLEAMYMRCPVIAVNSGGPLESVVNNVTGFLCEPLPTQFSEAMEKFVKDSALKNTMGTAGRMRVTKNFSSSAFSEQLHQYICRLTQ
ncbi:alpha-1,3/1,6-mannosyltransferase ALG2 isoform X3 [Pelodiscus sinensis]|uniref:alpha-1,3/1,6-mannosyltransferase ALG2 isoform X3 n=1 Tax=Pelodiscus sinensis TaxID=13735 RepID=UPI003F6D5ABD